MSLWWPTASTCRRSRGRSVNMEHVSERIAAAAAVTSASDQLATDREVEPGHRGRPDRIITSINKTIALHLISLFTVTQAR